MWMGTAAIAVTILQAAQNARAYRPIIAETCSFLRRYARNNAATLERQSGKDSSRICLDDTRLWRG
jgi:hypothetical protein